MIRFINYPNFPSGKRRRCNIVIENESLNDNKSSVGATYSTLFHSLCRSYGALIIFGCYFYYDCAPTEHSYCRKATYIARAVRSFLLTTLVRF